MRLLLKLSDFFAAFASFSDLAPQDAAKTVLRLARTRDFGSLGFLTPFSIRCKKENAKEVWREEIDLFKDSSLLSGEELTLLKDFSDYFGITTLHSFTDACRKYAAAFEGYYKKEKQSLEKSGTVTIGVGFLAAALIAIVCW